MTDEKPDQPPTSPKAAPAERRERRVSRYQRIQAQRAAKQRAESRFYNSMFGLMGLLALFAVFIGAVMINGVPDMGDGMRDWTVPWLFGWTKLEIAGVAFVGIIALSVWLRMRKRS